MGFVACGRNRGKHYEVAYVAAPQVFLRDRVAQVYNKTGVVKNGDRVEILESNRRFSRVRTMDGTEGWLEQRYLISQQVYDAFQSLARNEQPDPVQASATTRNDTNLHIQPGRDTDHLYLLAQGAKVVILKRGTSEKTPAMAAAKPKVDSNAKTDSNDEKQEPARILEDWWLTRDAGGHVGWILARMVDLDIPLEIAQYAEGQRVVAFFVLDEVQDAEKNVPQYLVALSEPKDGMPFDYDQIRVFTWNVRRHRYETAYRERNLDGVLPITISEEDFGKEGKLPVFALRVKDDNGNVSQRKYKLNTPIVRRVLAPGEQSVISSRHPSANGHVARHARRPSKH